MNPLYIAAISVATVAAVVAIASAVAAAFALSAISRAHLASDLRRAAVADALKSPLGAAGAAVHRGVAEYDPEYAAPRGATVDAGHPPRGDAPLGV